MSEMNFVLRRSEFCVANFEDFDNEQRGVVCTTCKATGIMCLGGSHPHRPQHGKKCSDYHFLFSSS